MHVELREGIIRLRAANSKNRRPRTLVLRGELLEVLQRRAAVRRSVNMDCVYVFHRNGKPLGNYRRAWTKACSAAGVEGRLFHDLRRSAVRNLVRAGTPEREDDIAAAVERTDAYVEQREEPKVRPLSVA